MAYGLLAGFWNCAQSLNFYRQIHTWPCLIHLIFPQVFILDFLVTYDAKDAKDAESIVERVTPRLQHANCAVVLSAVKVGNKPMFLP